MSATGVGTRKKTEKSLPQNIKKRKHTFLFPFFFLPKTRKHQAKQCGIKGAKFLEQKVFCGTKVPKKNSYAYCVFFERKKKRKLFLVPKFWPKTKGSLFFWSLPKKEQNALIFFFQVLAKSLRQKSWSLKKKRMEKVLGLTNISKSQVLFSKSFLKRSKYHKRFWIAEFNWRFGIFQI